MDLLAKASLYADMLLRLDLHRVHRLLRRGGKTNCDCWGAIGIVSMNIKKKLTACLVNPIKRELFDLQRKYPELNPQPLRSIKVLRPWDIPLLEHYLNHRTKILGR